MQPINQHLFSSASFAKTAKRSRRIFSGLALTSILSIGASLTLVDVAAAAPQLSQRLPDSVRNNRLPSAIANAVRQEASRDLEIAAGKLRVVKSERKTWPDPCLGVSRPDELCAQVQTEGWQVVVSDGSKEWIYRTDSTGRTVRRYKGDDPEVKLIESVENAVKQDLAKRERKQADDFYVEKAERREWPNGCLGIVTRGVVCTQGIVPGWEVTLAASEEEELQGKRWVYRTNEDGSVVKFDEAASNTADNGTIKTTEIPDDELPSPLSRNAIFRAIASGGIAGRTYETTLMKDGRVIQAQVTGSSVSDRKVIRRLSQQQVRDFEKLLEQQHFDRYNRLNYPPASGSADYITMTLTSSEGTTRYADSIQGQLPPELLEVINAWNKIATRYLVAP